jgi:NTE family protein
LSSGFLAFGAQAGFLAAVEERGLAVQALCGTSSGALAASLWAAGLPARQVLERLTERSPLRQVRPSRRPWRGMFSLQPVIGILRRDLPARFEDLERPLAVGVMDASGRPALIRSGPLAEAVAASCAIPRLFQPVPVNGVPWADGGIVDRTALTAWRALRPSTSVLLHLVERSRGNEVPADLTGVTVVRSPRSNARLWNLGDVHSAFVRSRSLALTALP